MLRGGAPEPLYEPANRSTPATIYFREDFVASALHEIAHWCIAGRTRREQVDYGYWYEPDGRSPADQARFSLVEARPQALEWCFSQAAGVPFRVSLDNLHTTTDADHALSFAIQVQQEARRWQARALPRRAGLFFFGLSAKLRHGFEQAQLDFSELPAV